MTLRLRLWQAECEAAFAASAEQTFLVNALPGGGKTVAAGVIARRQFLAAHPDGQIILVVPTDHMRDQWTEVLARLFAIQVTSRVMPALQPPFRGLVVTYAGAARHAETLRHLASRRPTLGICDEIHHAGDRKSWGVALAQGLEPCRRILALSGTAFRHDEARIPFLRSAEDADGRQSYVADYAYDFARALADGVVRSVEFRPLDGLARYAVDGFAMSHLLREAPDKERQTVLKILLNNPGYLDAVLRAADANLERQRARAPGAGGLAIAIDMAHAQLVADALARITGTAPDVVVSDDAVATSSVRAFAADPRRRWVVAVRMISEGVDVPRLMTLALLTNVSTRLFFRQAVGRVVRRQGAGDPLCSVFMPASRLLLEHASEIEQACAEAAAAAADAANPAPAPPPSGLGRPQRAVEVIEVSGVVARDRVFKGLEEALRFDLGELAPHEPAAPPVEAQMEALRGEISQLANRVARRTARTAHQVHRAYLGHVCKTPQAVMSLAQLEAKRDWLRRRLGVASVSVHASHEGAANGQ